MPKQLTYLHRQYLERYLKEGRAVAEIAHILGVNRSTVYREMERNAPGKMTYCAEMAQQLSQTRKRHHPHTGKRMEALVLRKRFRPLSRLRAYYHRRVAFAKTYRKSGSFGRYFVRFTNRKGAALRLFRFLLSKKSHRHQGTSYRINTPYSPVPGKANGVRTKPAKNITRYFNRFKSLKTLVHKPRTERSLAAGSTGAPGAPVSKACLPKGTNKVRSSASNPAPVGGCSPHTSIRWETKPRKLPNIQPKPPLAAMASVSSFKPVLSFAPLGRTDASQSFALLERTG